MKTNLMKPWLRRVMSAGVCAGLAIGLAHAQENPAAIKPAPTKPAQEKPAEHQPRPMKKPAKPAEKIAFLGVVLAPLDGSLAAQLDLPEGVGVLVRAVMPDGPAAKAGVRQHDVIHYFNDQLLVNEPQLQTLVRQAGIGAEVTLKVLRKGNAESITVKLGEQEAREIADHVRWRYIEDWADMKNRKPGEWPEMKRHPIPTPSMKERPFNIPLNGDGFADQVRELQERMKNLEGQPDRIREEIDRFRKEIQEQADKAAKQAGTARKNADAARAHAESSAGSKTDGGIRVEVFTDDNKSGSGGERSVTATADGKGNVVVTQSNSARMAWTDPDGTGELLVENGKKTLTVKDRDGKQTFSGPVDTEEQRQQLPPAIRTRLERIESNVKVEVRPDRKEGDI